MTFLSNTKNKVNEIRTERLARTANPLALVAQQQPVYHHQNHPTQNTQYSSIRPQQSTRNRGKAIVTSSAPTYDPETTTVTEDEEMSKEKEMTNSWTLISLSFKKSTNLTNNNLQIQQTPENVGTPGRGKSRDVSVTTARKMGMYQGNVKKLKRVKMQLIIKEKMLLCKQEKAGVQLNAEKADWKDNTDDESDD
ncbi:hypothetical protein Tco_0240800 [Tanacetum coccineum]